MPKQVLTLKQVRDTTAPGGTLGTLTAYVDGVQVYTCYVLEDPVRLPGAPKVYGDTAIPEGKYKVSVTFSTKFQKRLPLLWDIPNYKGVRYHGGNTKADTLGCPLLGTQLQSLGEKPRIGICAPAVNRLIALLDHYGEAWVEVSSR